MGLKTWQKIALVITAGLFLGVTPAAVYNATTLLLCNSCGWAWQAVRAVPLPTHPLKAAILNVTADFDELSHLLVEFMSQPGLDPAVGQQFKEFLSHRAKRSYPRLESTLDWLLAIYKFLFPFLIISMVAKLSSSAEAEPAGGGSSSAANLAIVPQQQQQLLAGAPGSAERRRSPLRRTASQQQQQQQGGLNGSMAGLAGMVPAGPSDGGSGGAENGPLQSKPRWPLALPRSGSKGPGGSGRVAGTGAGDRWGSPSPQGPETPLEGWGLAGGLSLRPPSARRYPPDHPAALIGAGWQARQHAGAAGGEIDATAF